jgi:hypothetical protein
VDGNEVAEANGRTLSVNRRTGLIRMRDLRGYESSSPTRASDNQLLARSRPILAALGATADQTQFAVRSLMVGSRDGDGTPVTDREMARKVMVTRAIAGIPVEADHIVLSYSLDGSLRKILGRWHQIDFDRSRFSTVLSDAETFEHAMQKLETESIQTNLSIARDGVARVRTVLVLAENTDEYVTFEPAGRVEVPTVGPGGTLTTVFDFDM